MLPPFRVRCLQRHASPGRNIQTRATFDALIRISAPEYDHTIRVFPEASLKYLDDDDGEMITVGSSLELIQRLESPSHENFQYSPRVENLPNSSGKSNFTENWPCPTTQNCHIFGIDCRISSLKIWREIERQSKEREIMLQQSRCSEWSKTGAASKNERDILLLSIQENREKTILPISSYRSAIAEDVCADDLKVHVDESDDASRLQELEDYRTAYFQASNPPQAKPSALVSQEIDSEHKSEMKRPYIENPPLARESAYPACNLTLEGKRQAQAAGDKLRARTTPSRRKREIVASFDQASYQNRWASYNDPTSSFHPGNLAGFNHLSNEPKLSSEGKRQQPQLAGDKLRCRTNPVRHAKSLRGPTDYGVNKNRRCSLAGSRVIHCNDRTDPSKTTEVLEAGTQGKVMQPSLLQVFEAELAKISSKRSPTESKEAITNRGLPGERHPVPSWVEPYFSAEETTRDAKNPLNGMGPMGPQPCVQVLELALRATLNTFGTCVTQIANCVHEVSATMQLADNTRGTDTQVLDDAVSSFRSFTEEIASLEKVLRREPESTEESRAKTDQRDDPSNQALKPGCIAVLWPISNGLESKELQDILLLHATQVESVFISKASEGGLRLAFCAVKDDASAQHISRKMAGQMLNGNRLNVVIAPAPKHGFSCKENDVFEKVAPQKHSPSSVLQNSSPAAPPSTNLSAAAVETSGPIDALEERSQNIKPAATNPIFTDRTKWRSDSKPANPISLLSNYARSGNRLKTSNSPTDSLETATEVDSCDSDPQIFSFDSGDMQTPLRDTVGTCAGISFDLEELWCSRSGSRPRTKLRPASILPLHNTSTNLLGCHEPRPFHLGHPDVPVLHGSSSSQNQSYLNSHQAASRSGPPSSDEYAEPGLGLQPVPRTPLISTTPLCGKEFIRSSDQSLLNSAQTNVEDRLNSLTESFIGRDMSGQKNAVRACRSMGTLIQRDDPVDHGRSQAREAITGKDRSVCALLGPQFSRKSTESVCDDYQEKKTDLPNHEARSLTGLKNSQASGTSSKLFSLPDNSDPKKSSREISTSALFSDQRARSGGLDQQPETSPLASRFPTLEQFECGHFVSASRFPTTPSTISLTDLRPRAQSTGSRSSIPQDSSVYGADNTDSVMSEVWNDDKRLNAIVPDAAETSGEFFNRMTRLASNPVPYHSTSKASPVRGSTGSCVRVARKSSSQASIATAYRNRSTDNVCRSATTAGLNDTLIRNNRRPYSENFSGNGRVMWDSFLHKNEEDTDNHPRAIGTATNQEAQTARRVLSNRAAFAFEDGGFEEASKERDVSFADEHVDAASVRKVQECVSQLLVLGFGGDADGGIRRLIVYAQAAEGDLVGAIDMIDEEKRAYKERV